MIIYLTVFSMLVFSAAMSAAIGALFYEVSYKFLPSTIIQHILGVGLSALLSYLMIKLVNLGVWYFYVATIGVALMLYILFIVWWNKYFRAHF